MYRSRLGNDLSDITLDYVSSIDDDSAIAFYDILGSQAHALMLYQQNIITKNDAKKILSSLESLKDETFDSSSGAEDIHELIEALVIKRAGMASGGKMHTARSRNDQVVLDIRMKIRDDINIICNCLLDTIEALVSVAKNHQKTIMPLYTHLQQAQAGLFSHYLLAHADVLSRDFQRLYGTFERINQSPLGAGPVGGTSIPIDRHSTAKMLGFDALVENSIDATSTRDFVAEYVSMISILMTNLSKIAEDFVIWSTSEFSFIELSDEFTSPSSVMPQKKNPDILELTRGKTAEVIGNLTAILSTIKGLASGYGRDLQQIKSSIWSTSKISINALLILKSMLLTLKVNEKQMKKVTESSNLIALDIAEKLVQEGIPFRVTHKIAGSLVQLAHISKKPISKLTPSDIKKSVSGTKVDHKLVSKIISSTTVVSSLKERKSYGSSGYDEQKRMISDRLKKINDFRTDLIHRENKISSCIEDLNKQINEII
ncbi:Argininosuccinate lyase protein [Marine Group I thaumarchaeote SCGC AAA799-E16]|uniref:Argininosuccinate lyase n=5 Tax=Marine Group I TaxID=905826 RepID=A0A087S759_9ARCH|nr:Argininosuccinate lyase protein [Marine Group I thaumarchaeote SCGC AAA799-E16]KFM17337.1 Argininosuccinate lyase protein [Marine Group I thaumarchaeote SCGC AAA799-D11]KFM19357.1 Argininosuccinate lyase protein [Marine Group I thaumarchaeote SCGC RSA3]KFM21563.1 Argininosuccinate lyase protein [Marine Group I thaumarchaeote SCGC AAA799-B03]